MEIPGRVATIVDAVYRVILHAVKFSAIMARLRVLSYRTRKEHTLEYRFLRKEKVSVSLRLRDAVIISLAS